MSKEVEWGLIHGEGEIVCTCDQCNADYSYDFDDGYPDYRAAQDEIRSMGWVSLKVGNEWYDFCSQECKQKFIDNLAARADRKG